jgi:hypothetical protein
VGFNRVEIEESEIEESEIETEIRFFSRKIPSVIPGLVHS